MGAEQTILCDGEFRYEVLEAWAKLPPELDLGEVAAPRSPSAWAKIIEFCNPPETG